MEFAIKVLVFVAVVVAFIAVIVQLRKKPGPRGGVPTVNPWGEDRDER